MEKAALYLCTIISCFIVVSIIWEFMNERYNRTLKNKYMYFAIEFGMIIVIAAINILGNAFLNLFVWAVGIGLSACFLYYENTDKPIKRILECEVLLLCIGICESLGVVCGDWLLKILHIQMPILIQMVMLVIGNIIILFWAPVENENRPLEQVEKNVFRKRVIITLLIADAIIFAIIWKNISIYDFLINGIVMMSILLTLEKAKRWER